MEKIAGRLHAIGKKVMINNAWCADPFEAVYRYGIDYRVLYESGVDILAAETLPTGLELLDKVPYRFQKTMSASQLMNVYNPNNKLISLLGVKDCTEEWDAIHHVPVRLEKDMFYSGNMYTVNKGELQHSFDGYFVTLGDGITAYEWNWLGERMDMAFGNNPNAFEMPTVIWSDHGHYALLDDYINTRRPSVHKQMYESQKRNASTGAVAKCEEIDMLNGALFVPNFDLLSDEEKKSILGYKKGAIICTAPADYVQSTNIKPDLCITDNYSVYKMTIFAFNIPNVNKHKAEIEKYYANADYIVESDVAPKDWDDDRFFLVDMPFRELSDAYYKSLAYLLNNAHDSAFSAETQIVPLLHGNGVYRIYVLNHTPYYQKYKIKSKYGIKSLECSGKFPVIPPKFLYADSDDESGQDGAKAESMKIGITRDETPCGFVAKVPPLGISVFDVKCFE